MRITDTADRWWKNAVLYCLDIETYLDHNNDGVGDLAGLARRIDYLAELGVTCLWLMPFYPTPDRDDGYDITDFYGVDGRLGDHGRVVEVIRMAHDRGLRVIADLVINHTSDQHPWFKSARRSKNSPYRDYYVWRSDTPPDTSDEVVFPDKEDSIWAYDDRTGEYYLHHFYSHQPDLNWGNQVVREELLRVMDFWLQLGLDGFRVDAVPFVFEDVDTASKNPSVPADPHDLLKEFRGFLNRRRGDAILLGEVNVPHADQRRYFGGDAGDELTMMFDFITMQNTYLSLARQDARPLAKALQTRPAIHPTCQWATFLRNHDELTLDKLTDAQRQEVFDAFGPDPDVQIYDRGLTLRLPTMLGNDPRRLKMAYSLLFSLPGTPTIYYGEEIGLGEDTSQDGRMAVRVPMQWTDGKNGGFSDVAPGRLIQPTVEGPLDARHVNVADQRRDRDSLWHFMATLISRYRSCPELGWGEFEVIEQPLTNVLVHSCALPETAVYAIHNFAAEGCELELDLGRDFADTVLVDLFSDGRIPLDGRGHATLPLDAYDHRWLRLQRGEPLLP
ncbi:alpha-amylase family protein [Nigerium massiliense]|uniref:alpha-amylase family protein n=1 Tax=Nigerium massiliense TaxID=1522317 RepID=UPI00058EBB5F|nr:alpha-amylase family protein [Nigerium massiliense]